MITQTQATQALIQELSERGFVKLTNNHKLRGLTEQDVGFAQKRTELLSPEQITQIKELGHYEAESLNRFAEIYYLPPHLLGKSAPELNLERLERIDPYALIVADFSKFCLYLEDVLKIVE